MKVSTILVLGVILVVVRSGIAYAAYKEKVGHDTAMMHEQEMMASSSDAMMQEGTTTPAHDGVMMGTETEVMASTSMKAKAGSMITH